MAPDIPFDPSQLLIGGRWRAADSGETLALENPSDGSVLARDRARPRRRRRCRGRRRAARRSTAPGAR